MRQVYIDGRKMNRLIRSLGPAALAFFALGELCARDPAGGAPQPAGVAPLHARAERVLSGDDVTFAEAADLADRLQGEPSRAGGLEHRGRSALLWIRAMRRALDGIPLTAARDAEPYRGWLTRHASDLVYSEPAGQWLIAPEQIWSLHDGVRTSGAAEAIAWHAVENGLPGECEGYPPCYLSGFTRLHGRYLQAYPHGARASQAVQEMSASLEQIERLLAEPAGHEFFNPTTDCDDLRTTAGALLEQLSGAPAAADVYVAIRALVSRCAG